MGRLDTTLRALRVIHYLETSRAGLKVSEIHQQLLHDGFAVDIRTVHRDMNLLQEAHVPLVNDNSGSESRWRLEAFAEIRETIKFTYQEIFALFVARRSLEHLKGTPLYGALDNVFVKLEKVLGHSAEAFRELIGNIEFRPQMTWHTSVAPMTLDTVYGGLEEGHPLKIVYRAEGGENAGQAVERLVGPECLYFANGGVYLIAIDLAKNEPRTYALARMTSVEMVNGMPYEKRGLEPEQLFKSTFGMLSIGDVSEVELLVTGPVAAFVAERRWHESQETVRTSEGTVVRFNVKINDEFTRFVLGLGPSALVVKPEALRVAVERMAGEVLAGYRKAS